MEDSDLARAQDPGTPAEELRRLASLRKNWEVKAAVAANPNVPPDVLWTLADSWPGEVLSNPGFELLPLEDPLWLQRATPQAVYRLMNHKRAPAWFVEQVLRGPLPLRRYIARQTDRRPVLWRLLRGAQDSERELLDQLSYCLIASTVFREHLLAEHGMLGFIPNLTGQPPYFLEAALASGLFDGPLDESRLKALGALPARHLERLLLASDETLRLAVARSRFVPQALLVRLARDPSREVREAVAHNARTPRLLAQALLEAKYRRPRPAPP